MTVTCWARTPTRLTTTATLTHTASGGDYEGETEDRIRDGRRRRVCGAGSVEVVDLNPAEGSSESYTVKLSSEPTAQVTVAITRHVEYGPESEHVEPDVHDVELGYGADGDGERAGQDDDATDDDGDASAHGFRAGTTGARRRTYQ